jgi:heterodisulfide reductase subunit A
MENLSSNKVGAVLVVGGGIGGIQASLDLANSGFKVYLVDETTAIGGKMAQLDKTFPTNDCAMCIISPKLVECGGHDNIEIITNSKIDDIKGSPGNFTVSLIQEPRYVREDKCVGCGVCAEKCPSKVIDLFNEGLIKRKAIYVKYPQAVPLVYMIDAQHCRYFTKGRCRLCEKFCESKAIDFEQEKRQITKNVGAVILAPGFEKFQAEIKSEYGYGRVANVITSLELERILSASGPYEGKVLRPSDKKVPQKIAWIQCVGSRDLSCGNGYCSSVCCMYATKQAIIAREHEDIIKPTIFYMDMRAYGKDFDKYYERAKDEYGVRYIRCMVSRVVEKPQTKNLLINYISEEGELKEEEFDLVVLSIGMVVSKSVKDMAEKLGIELNNYDFCQTDLFTPMTTSKSGIFVCGTFQGPKDIPETVAQASGAVACATEILSTTRGSMVKEKKYPLELDISQQEPRIGVFVCHCGINIGGVIKVPEVSDYAKTLDNVVYVENNLYVCSQDTQEKIKGVIKEHNLNRVVVASCSPRTHEPLFQNTLRETGLNKYLFEMANIRDQCSWVHMSQKEEATSKAKDLVRMAVANARLIKPLKELSKGVNKRGLVIGGGLSGMTAALGLAEQGFKAYLVEKEAELGGNLCKIHYTLNNIDVQAYLNILIDKVKKNPNIEVITNAAVVDFSGYIGNFTTSLMAGPRMQMRDINHGITIIATGGEELKPKEYLYGEDERVNTQQELEEKISNNSHDISTYKNVVMIQCVGSRNEERPYCSRVCCSEAIKNALKLKEVNPNVRIYILYRDMRTYGFKEDYYRKAREEGIIFIRYDLENKPDLSKANGNLSLSMVDPLLGEKMTLTPDLLVLSSATVPNPNNELSSMLKIPQNEDGFFMEAHVKLRPVDFSTDGIYICGIAHSPKTIDESIAQSLAAVARASTVLSKEMITLSGVISVVEEEKCVACLTCVRVCPYDAPVINSRGKAEIEAAKCQGCGICVSECPSKAIQLQHFRDEQIIAKCKALFMKEVT